MTGRDGLPQSPLWTEAASGWLVHDPGAMNWGPIRACPVGVVSEPLNAAQIESIVEAVTAPLAEYRGVPALAAENDAFASALAAATHAYVPCCTGVAYDSACDSCGVDVRRGDVQWQLRYGEPTREQMVFAASVLAAYGRLCLGPGNRQLPALRRAAKAARRPCAGSDPACPCQDGDTCHYRDSPITGTRAMRPGWGER